MNLDGDAPLDKSLDGSVGSVDWMQLLADFTSGDTRRERPAADAFIGVITGTLSARGAYDRRPIWEDVTQDVLLKLIKHAPSVRAPHAWVRQTTITTFLDYVRKDATQSTYGHLLPQIAWIVGFPTLVEEAVVNKEELAELRHAVEQLPPPLRALVNQVFPRDPQCEPDSHSEVAQHLGLQIHGVRNGLRRALALLARALRRERNLRGFRVSPDPEEAK